MPLQAVLGQVHFLFELRCSQLHCVYFKCIHGILISISIVFRGKPCQLRKPGLRETQLDKEITTNAKPVYSDLYSYSLAYDYCKPR